MKTPTTSDDVTNKIKSYCSLFGKPSIIFSDNGPHYSGNAFQRFTKDWGIQHITSSPTYSQSNGFIERQIGHIKPLLQKCIRNNEDINVTLLNIRATPIDHKLKSPAELMFERPIVTLLPSRHGLGKESDREALSARRDEMITQDNERSEKAVLSPLYPGQLVRVLSQKNNRWFPGTIIKQHNTPNSYTVRSNNRTIRRNRHHLREAVPTPKSNSVSVTPTHLPQSTPQTPVRPSMTAEPASITPKQLFRSNDAKSVTATFAEPPGDIIGPTKSPKPKVKEKQINTNDVPSNNTIRTSRSGRILNVNPKYV